MNVPIRLADWRYRAVILSVIGSSLAYLGFSVWSGWHEVKDAILRVGAWGIAAVLGMSLLNYGLRFIRWQFYLRTLGHRLPAATSLRIYIAGFALTTTPGKAGEILRAVLLRAWHVPYRHGFAALFSERLSDLIAIVLMTLSGLAVYPQAAPLILTATGFIAAVLIALRQRRLLVWSMRRASFRGSRPARMARHLLRMILDARRCHRPAMLLAATALSLLAWSAEALAFWWILGWMGLPGSLTFALFAYAVSMLSGALVFTPGGLGGAEAAMIALLAWQGAAMPDAIAATILIRLATLWFAVALGILSVFRAGRSD